LYRVLRERVASDEKGAHLPVILDVRIGEPLDCLGAGGKFVSLEETVEEGGMFLPNFIGFVDSRESLLDIHRYLNLNHSPKSHQQYSKYTYHSI